MSGIFWRILIAVVGVIIAFALFPPLMRIFGLPVSGDVDTVFRICVGGIAVFYVIRGRWPQ